MQIFIDIKYSYCIHDAHEKTSKCSGNLMMAFLSRWVDQLFAFIVFPSCLDTYKKLNGRQLLQKVLKKKRIEKTWQHQTGSFLGFQIFQRPPWNCNIIEGLTPPAADPGPFCGSDKANGNLSKRSIASFCRHGCGYRSWKWFQSCTELLFTFEAAMFSGLRAAVDVGMWWNIWELIKKTMWSRLIYILSVQWDCFEEFGRHGVHLSAASNGIKLQVSSGHERAVVVDVEGLERWGWSRLKG